ncbi:MAG: biotin/lipoyl-binding protein, partial [Polyangia bacterium]
MSDATTVDNGATGPSRARFLPLAAIAVLALGYGGYRLWQAHQPYEWSGTVEARTIAVGSRAGGRVKAVLVREGDRVKKGQPLLELEAADWLAQKLQAQGALQQAQ